MSMWDVAVSDGELADARADAEARMTSTCTIRRPDPATNTTDANGFPVPGWDVIYTDLSCRVGGTAASASPSRTVKVGDIEVQVAARVLHLPTGTSLRDGDHVEVNTGDVAGRVFRIVEATPADQQTAVRVQVLEVERPGEWT